MVEIAALIDERLPHAHDALEGFQLWAGFALDGAPGSDAEHGDAARRGFWASWPQAGVPAGLVLASAVLAALAYFLSDEQFVAWGYFIASNPANSFFYLLTGLHGLHLLGGLIAWSIIVAKFLHRVPLAQLSASVELCTLYWHYLLGLWFVLFALLASTPQTYEAIARFCGLR